MINYEKAKHDYEYYLDKWYLHPDYMKYYMNTAYQKEAMRRIDESIRDECESQVILHINGLRLTQLCAFPCIIWVELVD